MLNTKRDCRKIDEFVKDKAKLSEEPTFVELTNEDSEDGFNAVFGKCRHFVTVPNSLKANKIYNNTHGHTRVTIQHISKSKLKPHLLEYLRWIQETGNVIIVADHQIPVIKIEPYHSKKETDSLIAAFYKNTLS